jgi:hypothetical protein
MATILRGKRKSEQVEISQFCNDWVSIKGKPKKMVEPPIVKCEDNIGNDYFACGWNACRQQFTLFLQARMPSEEELADELRGAYNEWVSTSQSEDSMCDTQSLAISVLLKERLGVKGA